MQLTQKQLDTIKNQYRLSPRETQIVDLILQGVDSNEKIAKNIGISTGSFNSAGAWQEIDLPNEPHPAVKDCGCPGRQN